MQWDPKYQLKEMKAVLELDYRNTGGFVPIGVKEKADDVPAMLSKNEFVFTADAVRAAGGGSVQKGAQKMYNTMKMLEGKLV
jgi:predicted house-cleaning NTP pyrophosphatase (Maf/HAM1 superfamily)